MATFTKKDIALALREEDARLIAEAPKMYELLNRVFQLRLEIDASLCHVEGVPVPYEDEKDEED